MVWHVFISLTVTLIDSIKLFVSGCLKRGEGFFALNWAMWKIQLWSSCEYFFLKKITLAKNSLLINLPKPLYQIIYFTDDAPLFPFSYIFITLFGRYDYYSFSVIPAIGELVAGDRNSYQYLVESIRKFPSQVYCWQLIFCLLLISCL